MAGILEKGRTRYSDETKRQAAVLRDEGLGYMAIAERLGVSGDVVVRRWLDPEYHRQSNERAKLRARGVNA